MKIESPEFTAADVERFLDEFYDHEREQLARRLERASERLRSLAARIEAAPPPAERDGWNAREVLAHIALISKFYGMLTYKIGKGELTEFELLPNVNMRDVFGEAMSHEPVGDLVERAVADQARTAAYLRGAEAESMRRECDMGAGRTMSSDDVARLPLVSHIELHLDQLEARL